MITLINRSSGRRRDKAGAMAHAVNRFRLIGHFKGPRVEGGQQHSTRALGASWIDHRADSPTAQPTGPNLNRAPVTRHDLPSHLRRQRPAEPGWGRMIALGFPRVFQAVRRQVAMMTHASPSRATWTASRKQWSWFRAIGVVRCEVTVAIALVGPSSLLEKETYQCYSANRMQWGPVITAWPQLPVAPVNVPLTELDKPARPSFTSSDVEPEEPGRSGVRSRGEVRRPYWNGTIFCWE